MRHALAAFVVAGFLALPAASALPEPQLYWLKDRPTGSTDDGLLAPYTPLHPNVPNGTVEKLRFVFPEASGVEPVQFVQDEKHTNHLRGPLFAAIWPGPSTLLHGNLTVSVYELPAQTVSIPDVPGVPNPIPPQQGVPLPSTISAGVSDPFLPAPAGNPPKILLSRTFALDANLSNLPNPTTLVPPTPGLPPPTDPTQLEGYVLTEAFLELFKVYPYVTTPYHLFNFGYVDLAVNATARLAIGFTLDAGSSPAPAPAGVFASLAYDAYSFPAIAPSYLYLPWYNLTAPKASTQPAYTGTQPTYPDYSTGGNGVYGDGSSSATSSSGGKGSPEAGLLLLPALGLLAFALRRRLA